MGTAELWWWWWVVVWFAVVGEMDGRVPVSECVYVEPPTRWSTSLERSQSKCTVASR
jgi:hypothetical protein